MPRHTLMKIRDSGPTYTLSDHIFQTFWRNPYQGQKTTKYTTFTPHWLAKSDRKNSRILMNPETGPECCTPHSALILALLLLRLKQPFSNPQRRTCPPLWYGVRPQVTTCSYPKPGFLVFFFSKGGVNGQLHLCVTYHPQKVFPTCGSAGFLGWQECGPANGKLKEFSSRSENSRISEIQIVWSLSYWRTQSWNHCT